MILIDKRELQEVVEADLHCSVYGTENMEAVRKMMLDVLNDITESPEIVITRCQDCRWWRKKTDHTCGKWGGASPRPANSFCSEGREKIRVPEDYEDEDRLYEEYKEKRRNEDA